MTHLQRAIEDSLATTRSLAEGIRPGADEWRRFDGPIRRFLGEGLLEIDGDALRLTPAGVLLSNEVFQEFVRV